MIELADTSAWFASLRDADVRREFEQRVRSGYIATCDAAKLELLYAARSGSDFSARRTDLDQLPQCPVGPREFQRALDVYEVLAHQAALHHRRVAHVDLLVAAAAESAGLTLLHYDADFDEIAAVTGQPTRWLAQRGSL